jgi:hypothetical protein
MASSIDTTKPEEGNATTKSVRDNFATAKSEVEALQAKATNLDSNGNYSGGSVSGLSSDLPVADGGTGASTASAARSNLDVYSTGETDALVDDLSGVTDPQSARGNLRIISGQTTLNTSGTTTTVSESAVTSGSRVLLFPRDAGAASVEGIGSYVSAVNAGTGFTVTHADYSGTRTYDYLVIG